MLQPDEGRVVGGVHRKGEAVTEVEAAHPGVGEGVDAAVELAGEYALRCGVREDAVEQHPRVVADAGSAAERRPGKALRRVGDRRVLVEEEAGGVGRTARIESDIASTATRAAPRRSGMGRSRSSSSEHMPRPCR